MLEQLSSPHWWFSVVVIGILVNLISAYLKEPIDTFKSGLSRRWSEKIERDKEKRLKLILKLTDNTSAQVYYTGLCTRLRISALLTGVMSFMTMDSGQIREATTLAAQKMSVGAPHLWAVSRIVSAGFAYVLLGLSMLAHRRASRLAEALFVACVGSDPDEPVPTSTESAPPAGDVAHIGALTEIGRGEREITPSHEPGGPVLEPVSGDATKQGGLSRRRAPPAHLGPP